MQAVGETEEILAEAERKAEEEQRLLREAEEAEWRASFEPHAVIQTERTIPSQITICGLTGGAGGWLQIEFDLSQPPITYVQQVLDALPEMVRLASDGRRYVTFFGDALGFIINYSPDQALQCDLDGNPLEILPKAYRPGEVTLSIGGKPLSPALMQRLLSGEIGSVEACRGLSIRR